MSRFQHIILGALVRTQTASWRLKNRLRDEKGQTSTEYLVIAGVLAAILIGVLLTFKNQIMSAFGALGGQVNEGAKGAGAR